MKVALYPRVSTQEQALHGHSIGEQIDRLQNYCKAMGWLVYDIYTDAGFSGASLDRPGLTRLLDDVKAHKVDKVLVYKLDRLSRSQKDTLYLIEDCFLANGVDFVSMSENFDTSTPLGRAMIGILAVFAQLEREQIKERMIMGKEARSKKGLFAGGSRPPIGYDYIDGKLIVNEHEAIQIREAFEMIADGASLYRVAKIFIERGYTTKYGAWTYPSLRNVLRGKNVLGMVKNKGVYYAGQHEAIVSQEVYDRAQATLDGKILHSNEHSSAYLIGLLYCKQCGGRYGHRHRKQTSRKDPNLVYHYKQYLCYSQLKVNRELVYDPFCKNKKWEQEELEELVFSQIRQLEISPERTAPKRRDSGIKSELKKIDTQMSKLMDLYTLGSFPLDVLTEKVEDLKAKKEKLEASLLEEKINYLNIEKNKEVTALLGSFDTLLKRGNVSEVRDALAILIEKIELDGDDVLIHWNF